MFVLIRNMSVDQQIKTDLRPTAPDVEVWMQVIKSTQMRKCDVVSIELWSRLMREKEREQKEKERENEREQDKVIKQQKSDHVTKEEAKKEVEGKKDESTKNCIA